VHALGRALAAGLVQAEDAMIDIPKMVLPAMTEMVAPHRQLLNLMIMSRWDRSPGPPRPDRAERLHRGSADQVLRGDPKWDEPE
jgi:hypothetical protein